MKWPRMPWDRAKDRSRSAGPISLVLPDAMLDAMRAECERGLPNETGGVLVGHMDGAGCTVIAGVVGPGPRAYRTPSRFRRDGEYAQREVDRMHTESEGRDDYVGEWHSHPASVGPSSVDRGSMDWIGGNARYQRDEPVLIIMQRTLVRDWRPLAFRWVRGELTEVRAAPAADSSEN